jgi:hypothetical protein
MCRRERRPLPPQILNAPRLRAGLELYYQAFEDLHADRQLGFGAVGRIPWAVVDDWADRHGLTDDQRDELHRLIPKMDEVFVEHVGGKK